MIETKFKQTELGLIPMDWAVFRLGTISDIKTGPFGSSLHASDYVRYGTPIITVEHLGEPYILHATNTPLVGERDKKRLAQYSLRTGDIVYSRVGSVDRNSVVTEQEEGWLFSGRLLRVRNTFGYNASYLGYHLNSYSAKQRIISAAVGLGMPSINTKILGEHFVILPKDINEQTRIVEVLSDLDNLIRELDTLIEKKRSIIQGTMQDLLTVRRRLPGFDEPWKEETVDNICIRFDNLRIPVAETLRKKGNIPYYGANGIQDYVDGFTHDGEYILLAEDGANNLIDYPIRYVKGKIWVNNHAHVLQGKPNKADTRYLSYGLKNIDFESNIVGNGRAKLNAKTLMDLRVVIPSTTAEQIAIAEVLSDMDAEIETLESKRDKYIAVRQGMMQQLLTGKIRLI